MTGKLLALDGGITEMTNVSEVNVVGILAQMGARVITEVSNIMFGEFTKTFQAKLRQSDDTMNAAAVETKPISATTLAWEAGKRLFHRDS
jgi:hypothetical protein